MTDAMVNAARQIAPDLPFEGWTSHDGPPSIQGADDGALAAPPLLRLIANAHEHGATGIIVGCFDDTAMAEGAAIAQVPLIGIGQASFHFCALRQWRFSVVTTMAVSVPVIKDNIAAYGLSGSCARVRASDVPVLDLERSPEAALAPILQQAHAAIEEDGAGAIVLGCAGMVNVTRAVREALHIPVIDPVEAAVGCMRWMLD